MWKLSNFKGLLNLLRSNKSRYMSHLLIGYIWAIHTWMYEPSTFTFTRADVINLKRTPQALLWWWNQVKWQFYNGYITPWKKISYLFSLLSAYIYHLIRIIKLFISLIWIWRFCDKSIIPVQLQWSTYLLFIRRKHVDRIQKSRSIKMCCCLFERKWIY